MIDITLLGTGGTVPLPERWLTSLLVRWNGHELLIDCGEGTQIAMHAEGLSCRHIDTILLTHFHADHTAGLPGLLLSMAKADRTEPITIIGPKGLEEVLKGVYLVARYVPFEIRYIEIEDHEMKFDVNDLHITAFKVKHSVPCYGYEMELNRQRKFDKEKAVRNQVPMKFWGRLQKGETVKADGHNYTPDQVLGESRKGLRFTYSTDTRPVDAIVQHSMHADLLITEGMYGDPEKEEKAKLNRHMTMQEAASLAARADVKELWLTHYSPSMENPQIYKENIQAIFSNTVISKDGQHTELSFTDEEKKNV